VCSSWGSHLLGQPVSTPRWEANGFGVEEVDQVSEFVLQSHKPVGSSHIARRKVLDARPQNLEPARKLFIALQAGTEERMSVKVVAFVPVVNTGTHSDRPRDQLNPSMITDQRSSTGLPAERLRQWFGRVELAGRIANGVCPVQGARPRLGAGPQLIPLSRVRGRAGGCAGVVGRGLSTGVV
jgi:hypothetical protein